MPEAQDRSCVKSASLQITLTSSRPICRNERKHRVIRVGCHVSIKHGYAGAAREAARLGCSVFQYFPKNPRSLSVKAFDEADACRCRTFCREQGIVSVAHAPYPANLASDDARLAEATRLSLLNDLAIAEANGSIGVVVHFGKHAGPDPLAGYRNMLTMLNRILAEWRGKALLLIENQAGRFGSTPEELVQIRRLCDDPERVGFCLDTCHAFASGLWNGRNWAELEERGGELDFFDHVKIVHLNDSRYPSGSRRDAHANIGLGMIGSASLAEAVRSLARRGIPFVLETPESPALPLHAEMNRVKEFADD